MKLKLHGVLACLSLVLAQLANAQSVDPGFLLKLKKLYPATTFNQVNTTAVPGMFEVVMGQNVAYVDSSARYFMFGTLFDMQTQKDLTAAKTDEANKVDIAKLPLADAIKTVKGNGKRTLVVFSDPDCPFCKQLEKSLVTLDDVTVYTFLYPLEGLHPQAKGKSISIWCAKDRAKSWEAVMLKDDSKLSEASCANPVERNIQLATSMGITGTPTLFSGDGRKVAGAMDSNRLSAWLNEVGGDK